MQEIKNIVDVFSAFKTIQSFGIEIDRLFPKDFITQDARRSVLKALTGIVVTLACKQVRLGT